MGASLRACILALEASLGALTPALGASLRAPSPALGASPRAPTFDMGASLRAPSPALDASPNASTSHLGASPRALIPAPDAPRPPNGPLPAPVSQGPQPINCPSWMPTSSPSLPNMPGLQLGVRPPVARCAGYSPAARGPPYQPPDSCTPTAHLQHVPLCPTAPAVTDEEGDEACCAPSCAEPLHSLGNQTARNAADASGLPGMLCVCALNNHVAGCCSCC